MKSRVSVCGTAKTFISKAPVSSSCPDFYKNFKSDKYELVPEIESNVLVSFNHHPKNYKLFLKKGGSRNRAILVRLEPDSVFPAQYTERITKKYGLIISPGAPLEPFDEKDFIGWPYQIHLNPAEPTASDPSLSAILNLEEFASLFTIQNWEKRKNLITLIAANKVSATSEANYELRRKLARTMPSSSFTLYGPLWKGPFWPKARHRLAVLFAALRQGSIPNLREIYGNLFQEYPTSCGPIQDKHILMQDSKFALIIENSKRIVTEKMFDAVINGAIPLYFGPDLKSVGLPPGIAIEISGGDEEIIAKTDIFDSSEIEAHLNRMLEFTRSKIFLDYWTCDAVYRRMASVIIDYLERVVK